MYFFPLEPSPSFHPLTLIFHPLILTFFPLPLILSSFPPPYPILLPSLTFYSSFSFPCNPYSLSLLSELVDRCFGLLRSHVTCANCHNESVTFDPYNSLSLPIPLKTTKTLTVTAQLLPLGSVPVKFEIEVRKGGTYWQKNVL